MVTLFSSFCAYQISGESAKRLNYGRDVNSCHTDSPYFSLRGEILGFCFSSAAERLFRVLFGVERRYSPCGFFSSFFSSSRRSPGRTLHRIRGSVLKNSIFQTAITQHILRVPRGLGEGKKTIDHLIFHNKEIFIQVDL